MKSMENRVRERLERKKKPLKIKCTFLITETAKAALQEWAGDNGFKESPALEAMIRETIPARYFKGDGDAQE